MIALVNALWWVKALCYEKLIVERDNFLLISTLPKGVLDDFLEWGLMMRDVWILILSFCQIQ